MPFSLILYNVVFSRFVDIHLWFLLLGSGSGDEPGMFVSLLVALRLFSQLSVFMFLAVLSLDCFF